MPSGWQHMHNTHVHALHSALDGMIDMSSKSPATHTCTQGLSYNDLEKINPNIWRNTQIQQVHDSCNNLFLFKLIKHVSMKTVMSENLMHTYDNKLQVNSKQTPYIGIHVIMDFQEAQLQCMYKP